MVMAHKYAQPWDLMVMTMMMMKMMMMMAHKYAQQWDLMMMVHMWALD